MAKKSYSTDSITIRKTRLSDSDLILTLVTSDNGLVRAIAKSARKPGNTFSNRLELFNVARITCASCKNLDIIRECRLIETFSNIREFPELQSVAASVAELAWRCTFDGNLNDSMFDFLHKTFQCINNEICDLKLLQSAALIKLLAMEGFCPSLNVCSRCGNVIDFDSFNTLQFSYREGGVICGDCSFEGNDYSLIIPCNVARLMHFMLVSTYEELASANIDFQSCEDVVFEIIDRWIRYHIGYKLKSLNIKNI